MERLTYNDDGCWQVHGADQNLCKQVCEEYSNCKSCPIGRAIDRLAEYENKGLEPSEVLTGLEMAKVAIALTELERWKATGLTIERAAELGKADGEGRVVVLPCKIGDTVYYIPRFNGKSYCGVSIGHVQMVGYTRAGIRVKVREYHPHNMDFMLGKTVFLTREEAEKALEAENHERPDDQRP